MLDSTNECQCPGHRLNVYWADAPWAERCDCLWGLIPDDILAELPFANYADSDFTFLEWWKQFFRIRVGNSFSLFTSTLHLSLWQQATGHILSFPIILVAVETESCHWSNSFTELGRPQECWSSPTKKEQFWRRGKKQINASIPTFLAKWCFAYIWSRVRIAILHCKCARISIRVAYHRLSLLKARKCRGICKWIGGLEKSDFEEKFIFRSAGCVSGMAPPVWQGGTYRCLVIEYRW